VTGFSFRIGDAHHSKSKGRATDVFLIVGALLSRSKGRVNGDWWIENLDDNTARD
jgi:hypothetical protein